MPAVMIRQLGALARVMERTTTTADRQVLLDQADMIERLSAATVDEPADRADVSRAYNLVLAAHAVRASASGPAGVSQPASVGEPASAGEPAS